MQNWRTKHHCWEAWIQIQKRGYMNPSDGKTSFNKMFLYLYQSTRSNSRMRK
jgi:hypothetical protein